MDNKTEIRVPSTKSLTALCVSVAVGFGLLTVLSFRNSPTVFSFAGLAFTLTAIAGAFLFASLSRASAQARIAANDENEEILAEGIGRVGGKLTGLVVVATDSRIVAVPAIFVRRPRISVSIPYREVADFKATSYSLIVQGKGKQISLTKCAPNQVAALNAQLRKRASVDSSPPATG